MKNLKIILLLSIILPLGTIAQNQTTIVLNRVAPNIPVITEKTSSEKKQEKLEETIREWANNHPDELIAVWEQAVIAYESGNNIKLAIDEKGKTVDVTEAYNFVNWEEGFDTKGEKWTQLAERMQAARNKQQQGKMEGTNDDANRQ